MSLKQNESNTTNSSNTSTESATNNSWNNNTSTSSEQSKAEDTTYDASNTTTYTSESSSFTGAANSNVKDPVLGSTKNMNLKTDLYKELEIDRAWDEKSIRNHLKSLQKLWTQRQGATNDKEQLLLIDKILGFIEDGYRYLTKELKRQQYDKALKIAYKDGQIVDEAEEKIQNLLEQARVYYRKGKVQMAAKLAQEAVDNKGNDALAYDLLARCYFDTNAYEKAINIIDQGICIFKDNADLHWLGARIATIGTKNYNDAQRRINELIELVPEKSIGHSEQVYLHLRKGDETLAFQEIDSYIASNPSDDTFKRNVAYDLDAYSNTCYVYDAGQNASFIADKVSYTKCLKLRAKAVEIFNDEHTQDRLENAKYYGKKEWNDWNMPAIKSLALYGTVFVGLGLFSNSEAFSGLGIILYIIMGILIAFSFRPYWQINKTYVTGNMGTAEQIINQIGDLAAKTAIWMLKFLIKLIGWIFKFVIGLASGKWF
ncbi:Anaphase-promoting complex, cyclosome, subunit 3 [Hespellia stercorisuis DSM 15480]|uniref:Anaphase-promoting complex, cyclosome, subunit 3 n=1 Tax=Hespellia stercorisuis DSM 15480 TaxID=1121950 RepID=A0A1M6WG26_9FIRM|nr:Anaphase-promoting complex, cyclosome, subunit 3 [Hespellia stercorisuis DSM 15480]